MQHDLFIREFLCTFTQFKKNMMVQKCCLHFQAVFRCKLNSSLDAFFKLICDKKFFFFKFPLMN